MKQENIPPVTEATMYDNTSMHRRKFLTSIGITTIAVTGLASCMKTENSSPMSANSADKSMQSGTYNDIAILNYAYLLEQLEAAFYMMVTDNFYGGATNWEMKRLKQIRDHEIAHREFFKTALGSKAIPEQQFNFSSIDFTSRSSVLGAAKTFEDTGVSAYNGIAYAIKTPDYLVTAGKIVSVEARHAAYIRDLIDPLSFADSSVVNSNGLDVSSKPYVVVQAVAPYLTVTPDLKSFPFNI